MGLFTDLEHIVRQNEPLSALTWFRLGGPAEYYAEPTSVDELGVLVRRCREEDIEVRVLGGGSNVLVRDEGVPGLVVRITHPAFCEISIKGNLLTAGGGAKLSHVISTAVREGLAGLEQLVGIPGTVGGALHGNAGSQGSDIGQWTNAATVMTRAGEIITRQSDDMQFAYRQSSLNELAILGGEFELESEDPEPLIRRMQKVWIVKQASQPSAGLTTGCIFKNPRGMNVATLIEQSGLKGARVGQAEISERHANFVIAASGATSQDVLRLIELIQSQVSERMGVELECGIELW